MHDARALLDPATDAVRKLARRGYNLDIDVLGKLLAQRNATIQAGDELRAESKAVAGQVRQAASAEDRERLVERARDLKAQIQESEERQRQYDEELHSFLLGIPNLPEDRAPDGDSDEFAVEVRKVGTPPAFDFSARPC